MSALVFPRAMPASGITAPVFEPVLPSFASPVTGGAIYSVGVGLKRWQLQFTIGVGITQQLSDEWRTFLDSLDGANRTFFAYDPSRRFPRLYASGFSGLTRVGGGAFDGSLASWSQAVTSDGQALASFGGLPAGFELSTGDYADFRWTTSGIERRHMIRALADAVADGSGIVTGVPVSPPIHNLVPGTAVSHLDNPTCVMRIDPTQTQVTPMGRSGRIGGKVVAVQDLRQ